MNNLQNSLSTTLRSLLQCGERWGDQTHREIDCRRLAHTSLIVFRSADRKVMLYEMVKAICSSDRFKRIYRNEAGEESISPQSQVLLDHKPDPQRFVNSDLITGHDSNAEPSQFRRCTAGDRNREPTMQPWPMS
jgi:hypothetical protein